jgi:hypothetical protein
MHTEQMEWKQNNKTGERKESGAQLIFCSLYIVFSFIYLFLVDKSPF